MAIAARDRSRSRPIVIVLALLSVSLFVIDQAGDSAPTHPVRSMVRDASASVGSTLNSLWPFGDTDTVRELKRENAALQAEIDASRGDQARAADAERERQALTALLALPTPDNVPKVIARVTAIGASNFDSTIEIGKGSSAGISSGMSVVNGAGLIGRVIQTSATRSTVLLIADTTSNVGVRFVTGDIGVAVGHGLDEPMRADLIDLTSPIKEGDVAVTSGLQHSLFPPGIPVGVVKSVSAGPQDLRKDVQLTPSVDFDKLDNVAVLQWKP